jgi:hypothetical protein
MKTAWHQLPPADLNLIEHQARRRVGTRNALLLATFLDRRGRQHCQQLQAQISVPNRWWFADNDFMHRGSGGHDLFRGHGLRMEVM